MRAAAAVRPTGSSMHRLWIAAVSPLHQAWGEGGGVWNSNRPPSSVPKVVNNNGQLPNTAGILRIK